MSRVWAIVALCGLATVAIKGAGPMLLGGRRLPPRISALLSLLGPALLSALVAINTLGAERALTVDARLLGVAAGGVALWRRLPVLVVIVVAAASTAIGRALG